MSTLDKSSSRDQTEHSQAVLDVLAERRRQVEIEGWSPEHDDGHKRGEMALAAASYALAAPNDFRKYFWPWLDFWKPKDRRSNLVKAGALILAEIERLDRRTALEEFVGGAK